MIARLDATEYKLGRGITASFFSRGAGDQLIQGSPETFFTYLGDRQMGGRDWDGTVGR